MYILKQFLFVIFSILFLGCKDIKTQDNITTETKQIGFKVLNTYPHDVNSFTEGLFFDNGKIYESTGSPDDLINTKSLIGILNLKSGLLDVKVELDKNIYFGEGIAKCKDKIYQLTYKNKEGFIYNSKDFRKIGKFNFDNNEGWGLTTINDSTLVMSDGTNNLTFLNTKNLKPFKKIEVLENNVQVLNINELEYVDGYIFANIYTTSRIVKIDVKTGSVVAEINLESLCYEALSKFKDAKELNGIAYNNESKTFFITGKMWPNIYEIEITN